MTPERFVWASFRDYLKEDERCPGALSGIPKKRRKKILITDLGNEKGRKVTDHLHSSSLIPEIG
jgi:hypothetical protein